jgi:hypothetical protein
MFARMRRIPLWLVLVGGAVVVVGVLIQAGSWINGLHGFLALVILLAGAWYFTHARRALGLGANRTAGP